MIYYLSGNYGYEQYRESGFATGDTIDASDASWIVSNIGDNLNRYPFLIEESGSGLIINGGTINGEVPLDMDWEDAYVNSAAVLVRDGEDVVIQDWVITRAWDGIRLNFESDGFLIDNVWMSEIRDDAIENDDGSGGTISNSLFDGIFAGISLADEGTPADAVDKVVTIDGVLLRMEPYLYKGEVTHFSPLKIEDSSPRLEITNSVFAVDSPDHRGLDRQEIGWEKIDVSENNYFLNLSDEPFPSDYPLPGEGWTILQGQEARDYWESVKSDWIAEFEGTEPDSDIPEEPVEEEPVSEEPVDVVSNETEEDPIAPTSPDVPSVDEEPTPDSPETVVSEEPEEEPVATTSPDEAPEGDETLQTVSTKHEKDESFVQKFFNLLLKVFGLDSGDNNDDVAHQPNGKMFKAAAASKDITLEDVVPVVPMEGEDEPYDTTQDDEPGISLEAA